MYKLLTVDPRWRSTLAGTLYGVSAGAVNCGSVNNGAMLVLV